MSLRTKSAILWIILIQSRHHESTDERGAVAALAARVHLIMSNGGDEDTLICYYMTEDGTWSHVTATDLIISLRLAAASLRLQDTGIDLDLIGVHSLREGGASMALKLHGYNDTTIKKFGQWSSVDSKGTKGMALVI